MLRCLLRDPVLLTVALLPASTTGLLKPPTCMAVIPPQFNVSGSPEVGQTLVYLHSLEAWPCVSDSRLNHLCVWPLGASGDRQRQHLCRRQEGVAGSGAFLHASMPFVSAVSLAPAASGQRAVLQDGRLAIRRSVLEAALSARFRRQADYPILCSGMIACFNEEGTLYVMTTDFTKNLSKFGTSSKIPPKDIVW